MITDTNQCTIAHCLLDNGQVYWRRIDQAWNVVRMSKLVMVLEARRGSKGRM